MLEIKPGICQCAKLYCPCGGKCEDAAAVGLFKNLYSGCSPPLQEYPPKPTLCPTCALGHQFSDTNPNTAVLAVLFPTQHKFVGQARFLLG